MTFVVKHNEVSLKIICINSDYALLKSFYDTHCEFLQNENGFDYTLVVSDGETIHSGTHAKLVDKWFNNASADCYIDDNHHMCFLNNISADSKKNRDLFVTYFVENVFNRLLEVHGYVGIHSSACALGNKGVLLVASRGYGKTTTMLNLLNHGFDFITNDKCGLRTTDDNLSIIGVPQEVAIRINPTFNSVVEFQKYKHLADIRGVTPDEGDIFEANRLIISERELVDLNHVDILPEANLSLLVFPEYDAMVSGVTFRQANMDEVRENIKRELFGLVHSTKSFLKEMYKDVPSEKDISKMIEAIARKQAYYCYQNEFTNEEVHDRIRALIL